MRMNLFTKFEANHIFLSSVILLRTYRTSGPALIAHELKNINIKRYILFIVCVRFEFSSKNKDKLSIL